MPMAWFFLFVATSTALFSHHAAAAESPRYSDTVLREVGAIIDTGACKPPADKDQTEPCSIQNWNIRKVFWRSTGGSSDPRNVGYIVSQRQCGGRKCPENLIAKLDGVWRSLAAFSGVIIVSQNRTRLPTDGSHESVSELLLISSTGATERLRWNGSEYVKVTRTAGSSDWDRIDKFNYYSDICRREIGGVRPKSLWQKCMNEYGLSREVEDFEKGAATQERQLAELKAKRDVRRRFLVFGKIAQREENTILLHEAMAWPVDERGNQTREFNVVGALPQPDHNIMVLSPIHHLDTGFVYRGYAKYIRQTTGQNAFGGPVPIYVFEAVSDP